MSFPHLDRCSCGSPSSTRENMKKKQTNILDLELPSQLSNRNDYRSSPGNKKLATTNNNSVHESNLNSKQMKSTRSQPSLQDENLRKFRPTKFEKLKQVESCKQDKGEANPNATCSDKPNSCKNNTKSDSSHYMTESQNTQANNNNFFLDISQQETEKLSTNQLSAVGVTERSSTKAGGHPSQINNFSASSLFPSRDALNGKHSLSNVPDRSKRENQQTSRSNVEKQILEREDRLGQTSGQQRVIPSTQVVTNESPSNAEYTPLSYDINYVKVSPPRLTRRPKKSDESTNDTGPLTRAQQLVGRRSWEEKPQHKRTLKAPAQAPPAEGEVEKMAREESEKSFPVTRRNTNVFKSAATAVDDSHGFDDEVDCSENKEFHNYSAGNEEVLELTFTVFLEKGTLKKVNKGNGEDGNSATIKIKTDNVRLDSDSKRLVAESITEALKETAQMGNISFTGVDQTDCSAANLNNVNFKSKRQISDQFHGKSTGTYGQKMGETDLKHNLNLKGPNHDRTSMASKSFDCNVAKNILPDEALTSYQSLDRKQTIQKDRKGIGRFDNSKNYTIDQDEYSAKKYQTLNNFSPIHNRLATSAQIHKTSGQGSTFYVARDRNKSQIGFHSRYDSDICDYEAKENRNQKGFKKPTFNNNQWFKNGSSLAYGSKTSKDNGLAVEEEMTHMNWDDLMKEAKSLGIPLKRPDKMTPDPEKETHKFSQSNITSRFLKNFGNKKSGLKLTKSVCGGELGRNRDEYFNDLCSASYQCTYDVKKISPFKEKFRFMDILLGRTRSSKNLSDDCPLCRQQQHQQPNFLIKGRNLIKRSISTNRGICLKQAFSSKHSRCARNHCPECNCSCYCSYQMKYPSEAKVSRSNSSPPPASSKQNIIKKVNHSKKFYDFCCQEPSGKTPKTTKKIFDTFSLSDGYRSLLSPKRMAFRSSSNKPDSSCCQPYTPQNHHRQFQHLFHLNSCGDDGGYDEDNDCDDNKDDVFLDDVEPEENKRIKNWQNSRKENLKSGSFDETDGSTKNAGLNQTKNAITAAPKATPTKSNSKGLLRSLHLLRDKGWYWGNMTFEIAEEKLTDLADGSFLVRDSSDDRYILSVSFRSQGKTHHTRIEHIQGVFSFYSQRMVGTETHLISDPGSSTSIVNFIEDAVRRSLHGENLYYLRGNNDPEATPTPVKLLHPVSRFTVPSLKDSCLSLLGDVKA